MKKLFSNYFTQKPDFFIALWGKAYFALDTNVLLDLYRYSDKTRNELLAVLTSLKDRIWIPHQVGLEFARNRPEVISTQVQMYQKAKDFIASLRAAVQKEITTTFNFRSHPVLNPEEFRKSLEVVLDTLLEKINKYQSSHPDFFAEDPVLVAVCDLLDGRVGSSYNSKRMEEIFKAGKLRYEKSVPPGYADSIGSGKKEDDTVYGDLVLWFQLIDQAKVLKRPFILVSNDMKEDWWWQSKGRTLGCRPELRDEFLRESSQDFYMYTSERFLEYAPKYLKVKVSDDSIKEIKTVHEEDQQRRAESARNYTRSFVDRFIDDNAKYEAAVTQINTPTIQHFMDLQKSQENALKHLTQYPLWLEDAMKQEEKHRRMVETLIGGAIPNWLEDAKKQEEQHRRMVETLISGAIPEHISQLLGGVYHTTQPPSPIASNEGPDSRPGTTTSDDTPQNDDSGKTK